MHPTFPFNVALLCNKRYGKEGSSFLLTRDASDESLAIAAVARHIFLCFTRERKCWETGAANSSDFTTSVNLTNGERFYEKEAFDPLTAKGDSLDVHFEATTSLWTSASSMLTHNTNKWHRSSRCHNPPVIFKHKTVGSVSCECVLLTSQGLARWGTLNESSAGCLLAKRLAGICHLFFLKIMLMRWFKSSQCWLVADDITDIFSVL